MGYHDQPYTLSDPAEIARRKMMLTLPHVDVLARYAAELRTRGLGDVPDFDPLDGGINARAIFLFEKPGPRVADTGFVSRNNPDPTAATTYRFMEQAGFGDEDRCLTAIWNLIPGWDGKIAFRSEDTRIGVGLVTNMLRLFKQLKVIVLVGRTAQRAGPYLSEIGVPVIASYHPSRRARRYWSDIVARWSDARRLIE